MFMENVNAGLAPVLDVKIDKGSKLINTSDVLYIKGNDKNSVVYFTDDEMLDTRHLLKWYEENLPEPLFCRCHDSFIVSCGSIHCISGDYFVLKGDVYVKISKKYKTHALDTYALYVKHHKGH
jgi:DNA-binding LytR/AlgR family response regulator